MLDAEAATQALAEKQLGLVSCGQALAHGMSRWAVNDRVAGGRWRPVFAGVYLIGVTPPSWEQRLLAACLFAGPRAVVSHRAAGIVWKLDGLVRAPLEITVPHHEEAALRGVVVHRSRKLDERDAARRGAIPVTSIERTLVDLGRYLEPRETEKALESALRMELVTPPAVWTYLEDRGGRIPGCRRLRAILLARGNAKPAGSGGEVEFIRLLRQAGLPPPERQFRLQLPSGRVAFLDFAWPDLRIGMEYDGYDPHSGRLAHASDLERQNEIVVLGWTLLRYGGKHVRRKPTAVVAQLEATIRDRTPVA
ncbi:MAG TPA: DUF559 domain-containing protein [Acidimicrobiales bacterium]|nr:DUF559 domain-containing protein [Acidimicrobiales bacterium]